MTNEIPHLQGRETRTMPWKVQKRADGSAGLVGTAVVYNQLSDLIGGFFREKFQPGAFKDHLAGQPDVRALLNHETRLVLGRTPNTLRLTDTPDGLTFELDLPDVSYAKDLLVSIERGDITGMSFAFDAMDTVWDELLIDNVPTMVRTVLAARLYEISPVTFPAYPQTEVALRSLEQHHAQRGRPNAMRHLLLDVLEKS